LDTTYSPKLVKLPATPWGQLPTRLRVLVIAGADSSVGSLTDVLRSEGSVAMDVVEAAGPLEGLTRLRDHTFDAVLLVESDAIKVPDVVAAIRGSGAVELPVLLLSDKVQPDQTAMSFEDGADGYVCMANTSVRSLIWIVSRTVERATLLGEYTRLERSQERDQQAQQEDARSQIAELRQLIENVAGTAEVGRSSGGSADFLAFQAGMMPNTVDLYRQILRDHVLADGTSQTEQICKFCDYFRGVSLEPSKIISLHLTVLDEMVEQLGVRSSRHVMNRGNLLLVELLVRLSTPGVPKDAGREDPCHPRSPGLELTDFDVESREDPRLSCLPNVSNSRLARP